MRAFRVIKSILGYLWALTVIPVVALGFVNMSYFEQKLIIDPGFRVSGNWTGGEALSVIRHDGFTTTVHKPVFNSPVLRKDTGFVQVDWSFEGRQPEVINEEIDYDADGRPDFWISVDTGNNDAVIKPYSRNVITILEEKVMVYKDSRSVRVVLKK